MSVLPNRNSVVARRPRVRGDVLDAFGDTAAVEQYAVAVDARERDLLEVEDRELEQMAVVVDHVQPVVGLAYRERDRSTRGSQERSFRSSSCPPGGVITKKS